MITSWLEIHRESNVLLAEAIESDAPGAAGAVVARGRIPPPLPSVGAPPAEAAEVLRQLLVSDDDHSVEPREAGAYLYRLLAEHGLGEWLSDVRRGRPEPRSVFVSIADGEFRRLPWELLVDPQSVWAPFLDADNTWTRATVPLENLPELTPPVRVLFVAGAYDDVQLYADDELDAITRALCRQPADFHVEYLVAPTRDRFESVYAEVRPHILHVVAHGTTSLGSTVLSLREGLDGAWSLTPIRVANGLSSCPRLVVLNACRSGVGSSDAAWGFSDLFLDKGAGAVVTMQGDIPAEAGVAFTEVFYKQLAARKPVDVAAQQGRRAVFGVSEEPEVWALPTLTLHAAASDVLRTRQVRPT